MYRVLGSGFRVSELKASELGTRNSQVGERVDGMAIDVELLKQRTWPRKVYGEAPGQLTLTPEEQRELSRYDLEPYVDEGRMICRPLGKHGVAKPIPYGECGITSLVLSSDGRIFGGTMGRRAHLFVYDPGPAADNVIDLGVVMERPVRRSSAVSGADGRVFIGTWPEEDGITGEIWVYTPANDRSGFYIGYTRGPLERFCTPAQHTGVVTMAIDDGLHRLYTVNSRGEFLVTDLETRVTESRGQIDPSGRFDEVLVRTADGRVWGGRGWGRLFFYDPVVDAIERTDLRIPSVKGRNLYNTLDSVVVDARAGRLYGAGRADGVLFYLEIETQRIVSLGKPVVQPRVRCLTVGGDGRLYGVGGASGGMGHLFRYDPVIGELRDLGIPLASSERYWHGYEFAAAVTGASGEIYLGECDRISHLFIYFPPY
jgi:hypothetical protein